MELAVSIGQVNMALFVGRLDEHNESKPEKMHPEQKMMSFLDCMQYTLAES